MRSKPMKSMPQSFNREGLSNLLFDRIGELPLLLSQLQFEKLIDYLALLNKWNSVYNLTAVREPEAMVTQHLLDSLAVVPAFEKARWVLDVGAGGGLPGIVLAIARPDMQLTLIDTVQKKTAFLSQVKAELDLANVTVLSGRVEQLDAERQFDTITSRAFASLADMVTLSAHLLAPGGQYIAMKGVIPDDEMAALPPDWDVTEVRAVTVPGLKAERHLIFLRRQTEST